MAAIVDPYQIAVILILRGNAIANILPPGIIVSEL